MNLLITLIAFLLALGLLIVVHEFGHYLVARWCGVKVLRFSVGFGQPLFRRRLGPDQTEWVVAAFPLGGYVKMLDEREGDVSPGEAHRAFNRKSVYQRFAIVLAGPAANFLLAIAVYWILFLHGVPDLKPVMGPPPAGTPAAAAQIAPGDTIASIDGETVTTWQDVRWVLLERAVGRERIPIELRTPSGEVRVQELDLSAIHADDLAGDFLHKIGLVRFSPALVGKVREGSAAARAGIQPGDVVIAADGKPVGSFEELVQAVMPKAGVAIALAVRRGSQELTVTVIPDSAIEDGKSIGRIGVERDLSVLERQTVLVRYGPVGALVEAAEKTWDVSVLSLRMLGKMIVGQVSLRNLSGPITIADYAGQTAQMGWLPYVSFIALISISLGVLNLLPVPVLDGGHLMYYIVEIIKGRPVSDRAMEIGQRVGMVVLFTLMAFAIYNDIHRLVGGG
jgi:regulator of sigma E protease